LKKKVLSLAALALIMLFSGCGNQGAAPIETSSPEPSPVMTEEAAAEITEEPALPTATPAPQSGGLITLSMRQPKTLNPLFNEDITVDLILKLIFEPLTILNDELKPIANPRFVQSIDYSTDGMSAFITLDGIAVWNDGRKIVADDVVFSIETLKASNDTAIYKECVRNIASVEVIGETTAIIHFAENVPSMLYMLKFPIIPKHHYFGETETANHVNMNPIGNGVYRLDSYTPPREMVLTASDSAQPYVGKINVIISPNAETDERGFETGLTDAVSRSFFGRGKHKTLREVNTTAYPSDYFDLIGFNFGNEKFQAAEVRKAIAGIIPFEAIISGVYLNLAEKSTVPINPKSWLYESEITQYEYDVQSSLEVLAGKEMSILVNNENEERVKIAELLKSNLEKANVTAEILSVPFEEFEERLDNGNFELFVGGYELSEVPDLAFLLRSGNNAFKFADDEMDRLVGYTKTAVGETQYKQAFGELQRYVSETLPFIGIAFRMDSLSVNKRIFGEFKPNGRNPYAYIDEWYFGEI